VEILVSCTVKSVEGNCGDYKVKVMQRRNIVEGCTLCGKCVSACPVEVDDKGMMRKAIYYVPTHPDAYALDAQNCTKCGRCKEVCEKINLEMEEEEKVLEVGAVVVATGLSPYDATLLTPYGYGKYEGVMTALEFERRVAYQDFMPKRCVIIGCAGSRDEAHLSYCSRVCCLIALKEAKLLKDKVPDAEVYLTYIDMRSYGELEQFYTTLRNTYGVCFIEGRPAEVTQRDGHLVVHTEDLQLGRSLQIETDCVVLSVGFCPDKEVLDLLKIQTNNGFPTHYVHATRSSDSNLRGIYFVGAASFPKAVAECMAEAREVGGQVVSLLRRDEALFTTPVASINADICAQINCKICLSTCPYGAIKEEEEEKLSVDPSICMGCGICTATCAAGANELEGASTAQILAQIETLAKEGTVLALLCRWSAYPAADLAGYMQLRYPDEVRIVQVPCTGRVDGAMILKAFSLGAKAVLLGGCYPDACHYVSGNFKARKREMAVAELLQQFGIQKERVRIEWIGKAEAKKLVRILNQLAR
jgi:heterodisulfide reductase subunit A